MPENIDATIDSLADLIADAMAVRSWLARRRAGHDLSARDRAALARRLAGLRDTAAAALDGARKLGHEPADAAVEKSPPRGG